MVVAIIAPSGKFFWNLTGNVGLVSPNRTDDFQFVQFGYFTLGRSTKLAFVTPEDRAVYARVKPGEGYNAVESDPLTLAIRTHQRSRGGTQDGHVSRVSTNDGRYIDSGQSFIFMLSPRGRDPERKSREVAAPARHGRLPQPAGRGVAGSLHLRLACAGPCRRLCIFTAALLTFPARDA